jgi:cytoskeletal protein RodZ
MDSFGGNLRRERELRGATLAELSNATKIHIRYLQALEEDQFDLLPGGLFGRGFVRAVARYLKLDEKHWVSEFVRAADQPPEVVARYSSAPPPSGSSHRTKWSFALLVVVFGVGAYLIHDLRLQRAAEASPPDTPPVMSVPAPEPEKSANAEIPEPVVTEPLPVASSPATPAASTDTIEPPAKPTELRLQVDVIDDAWVKIAVDGQPDFEGLMKAGATRSFRGTQQIELVTGNASAVVLTLNSETLPPLGNPGERKTVLLTAKDLKPSTP